MSIIKLLAVSDCVLVDKELVKKLGSVKAAYFYYAILQLFKNEEQDALIHVSREELRDNTGLSFSEQKTCIKILKANNLISTHLIGMPGKRYFKLIK